MHSIVQNIKVLENTKRTPKIFYYEGYYKNLILTLGVKCLNEQSGLVINILVLKENYHNVGHKSFVYLPVNKI